MTEFGRFEKVIIEFMVSLHKSNNLSRRTLVYHVFGGKISVEKLAQTNPSNPKALITYEAESEESLISKLNDIQFLIERLSKDSLIKVDLYNYIKFEFPDVEFENKYDCSLFGNNIWYNMLIDQGSNIILISNYLIDLVENDFKTPEQRRHNQVLFWTRAAFVAAFLGSIITATDAIIRWNSPKDNSLQNELLEIKQTIEQKTLPDVFKTKITNDTLTTNVVEMPKVKSTIQSK